MNSLEVFPQVFVIFAIFQRNLICLWNIRQPEKRKYFDNEATDGEPEMLCSVLHSGSVTDIEVSSW